MKLVAWKRGESRLCVTQVSSYSVAPLQIQIMIIFFKSLISAWFTKGIVTCYSARQGYLFVSKSYIISSNVFWLYIISNNMFRLYIISNNMYWLYTISNNMFWLYIISNMFRLIISNNIFRLYITSNNMFRLLWSQHNANFVKIWTCIS
jgi:hypothetical protein